MLISRATSDDVAAVAPLFDSYRAFFAGGSNLEQSRRFLDQRLVSAESVLFVARDSGNAVGLIQR